MTEEQKKMKKYCNAIERRLNLPRELKNRVMSDFASSIQERREAGQTDEEITYPVVPAVVFTLPRIATVGIPVYKALNMEGYNIHRIRYGDSYSIELKNDRTAEVTVVTDPDMNIVGAELYGPEAENMANIFAFIINKNISLEELDYFIYAFPSSISVMLYKMHNIHYKIGDRKE